MTNEERKAALEAIIYAADEPATIDQLSAALGEEKLAVQSALGRLSEDQREAVLLKVYQGFKFEEMAEILACPVSTVKSRLYTALDLLKQTLAPVNMGGTQ